MEEMKLIVYVQRDLNGSIIQINSNVFIDENDLSNWEKIDEWVDGQDRYLYSHASNGEYVMQKRGKPLYDEDGRPNFYGNFLEWNELEKQEKYPIPEPEPSELDKLKMQQEITDQAVQDLILMMMGGGE